MSEKIRIGICGFGNLGKGVIKEIEKNPDMELVCVFTRREPNTVKVDANVPVIHTSDSIKWKDKIDVCIMCGGSAKDLPEQVPEFAQIFNTVDSFDTHADIPDYLNKVNKSAENSNRVSVISVGWDPGMFSINRVLADAILPKGETYTFWGKGVSQGHSDAIRKLDGVKGAIQYTVPIDSAVTSVRNGEMPNLTTRQKHLRECFVVLEENANKELIEKQIKEMPKYFSDYDVVVNFISEEELKRNHSKMPHGGFVIRSGETGDNSQIIEYSLKLESNPEFTASVLIMYARATYRLYLNKDYGAKTVVDIPPVMLSPLSREELIKKYV